MAKTFDELMKQYGHTKIGAADMALGRDNPGALETILKERQNWANATTQEEKTAAHNRADNMRIAYGKYSGGADGMKGKYSPTYVKPSGAAENSNVDALFNKFNEAYKNPAPTWTPRYEAEIQGILSDISNRKGFSYDMNEDKMYQQYRDQYIREGQRAMKDTAAQTAALTGGYGSTYGAIAAQQGYDNYLAGLNDRVPQLEQMAYGRYTDELADKYNQLGAYQTEENRLYGQYMDALGQYNTDRNFAFGSMQAALMLQQKQLAMAGSGSGGSRSSGKSSKKKVSSGGGNDNNNNNNDNNNNNNQGGTPTKTTNGYTALILNYKLFGDSKNFEKKVNELYANGSVTDADYEKFLKNRSKLGDGKEKNPSFKGF